MKTIYFNRKIFWLYRLLFIKSSFYKTFRFFITKAIQQIQEKNKQFSQLNNIQATTGRLTVLRLVFRFSENVSRFFQRFNLVIISNVDSQKNEKKNLFCMQPNVYLYQEYELPFQLLSWKYNAHVGMRK